MIRKAKQTTLQKEMSEQMMFKRNTCNKSKNTNLKFTKNNDQQKEKQEQGELDATNRSTIATQNTNDH